MKGYLILEFTLPDEPDGGVAFGEVIEAAKQALDGHAIDRVTGVHAAVGIDGLRQSVTFLEERDR